MVPLVVWVPAALLVALLLYIVLMSSYAPSALDVRGKHMVITGEATRRCKDDPSGHAPPSGPHTGERCVQPRD